MSEFRNSRVRFPLEEFRDVIHYFQKVRAFHIVGILESIFAKTVVLTHPTHTKKYGMRHYTTTEKGHRAAGGIGDREREALGLLPGSWLKHPDRLPDEYVPDDDENGEENNSALG